MALHLVDQYKKRLAAMEQVCLVIGIISYIIILSL